MIRRRLWARRSDDRGTSLVLALIFITVGSLVLMAVLALADTNMRATILLTSEASGTAAAEGAANIAINDLRDGIFDGVGTCFTGGPDRLLPRFYQRPDGTWDSARVTCDLDPTVTTTPYNTPPRALLTVDTTATGLVGPFGIWVTNPQVGLNVQPGSLGVAGDVWSNSNIVIQTKTSQFTGAGNLTATGTIRAIRACTSGSGLFNPTPTCNSGTALTTPVYPTPLVAGLPNRTVPACAPVVTFQPGHYGSPNAITGAATAAALSALTSLACQGGNVVIQFLPGIYYFEFGPSTLMVPWTIAAGTVIGGALRAGVTLGPGLPLSNNCRSPVPTGFPWQAPATAEGVTFVFSGGSQMNVSGSAKVELCGRYDGRNPPMAVTAEPTTGTLASTCNQSLWPCAAIWTTTPTGFVVQGTVYTPSRELVLGLSNGSTQDLRGGAVVHRAWANTTRTSSTAVIETRFDQPRTVVYLNVYVCPNSSSCITGGQLRLRTKVSIVDPSPAPPVAGHRQVTVLSWSLLG